ncbi:MAG: ABA4-like family protein [Chloroflexota bacterium]
MEKFYQYINAVPMPLWLGMMFAPKSKWVERGSRSSSIFMITAVHYVMAIINAIRQDQASEGQTNLDLSSLEGIRQGLSTRQGALAGWTHMLALDLFTGAWIYRQCQKLNAPSWLRVVAIGFTLMTGPFGLLIFLGWRWLIAGQSEAFEE